MITVSALPAGRGHSAGEQLSLFITGGFSPPAVEFTPSAVAFVAFFAQTKAVISIPFFGHFIIISVHRKVAFYGLFILFRATFPPLSDAGEDKKTKTLEVRYE